MISIVDYGAGNVFAFKNIFRRSGIPVQSVNSAESLSRATKIILPGVGSFDWAMRKLHQSGMIETLNDKVKNEKVPVLGVCVGMQIMAHSSEEGELPGLSWIDAQVKRFDTNKILHKTKLPHMGWNKVEIVKSTKLFKGIKDPRYYFLHSFYMETNEPSDILGKTDYGNNFTSAIASDNVYATQFHPEKSHELGIQLLVNFAKLC